MNVSNSNQEKNGTLQKLNSEQFHIYEMLHRLEIYSEQARWARLNIFLVTNSILLVSWAAIFASTNEFPFKAMFLGAFSFIGVILSGAWVAVGYMTNQYHKVFDHAIMDYEEKMKLDMKVDQRPYRQKTEIYDKFKNSKLLRPASTTWILIWIPSVFCLIFISLFVLNLL